MQVIEPLLGTRAELAVTASSPEVAAAVEDAAIAEATRLEALFTVFDPASALHAYRRRGGTDVPELREVIDLASWWRVRTGGVFHPAIQPLVDLWDAAERDGAIPAADVLAAAAADVQKGPVRAADVNLNAIAKGWIAEHALGSALAADSTVSAGWFSLGGDVVHRGAGSVTVGIEDPHRPYDNVAPLLTVELANEALATSGGARRWWTIDGTRYPKVLDPRSGHPVSHVASATVIAEDGASADVLATVATVATPDETLELVAAVDAACLLIGHDGSVISSSDRLRPSQTR